MTQHYHFSIALEFEDELKAALDAKARSHQSSRWICETLRAKWREEQRGLKITDKKWYQQQAPNTMIETVIQNKVYEELKQEDIQQLTSKELIRLAKTCEENMYLAKSVAYGMSVSMLKNSA